MRRTALILVLLIAAVPVLALNRSRVHAGDRVGVLQSIVGGHDAIERALVRELQQRGVDAFAADITYDELVRGHAGPDAAWYVEIAAGGDEAATGGVAVGVGPVTTAVDVVHSDIVVQVRLFDARTIEEIDRYEFRRHGRNVVPAGVSVDVWPFRAWMPIAATFRENDIAREAAARIKP